ncbi:MAG TPA: AAA family ATPase [Solirubrobacterales bacterium]|nr:AAA family ATPase [Solirubrobacterales bacterium]
MDAPTPSAPLFEREPELGRLHAAAAAARDGAGGLLLVEGDPGIGKTALLAAAAEIAAEEGLAVFAARGGELEESSGFGIVQQLLERSVAGADRAERERLLAGAAGLAAAPLGLAAAGGLPLDPARARHGLYWLLANLVENEPAALLVDDAHWADRASLDWLLYLVRRLERLSVLVVVAHSPGEAVATRSLLDALAVEPAAATIRLVPLSERGTAAALAALDGGVVEEAFAAACHDWTGGNPHFVAEAVAELAAEGLAPGPEATERLRSLAPERVAAVTQLRLGRLSPAAGDLVAALAILGGEAPIDQAADLAGLTHAAAVGAADELAGARFVAVAPRLRFLAPMIGRVVHGQLGPARRAADHARAARLLEEGGAGADAVAAQLLHAAPAADPWVVGRLREAAGEELARGSAIAAVPLLRRALAEPPPGAEVAATRAMLGLAESMAGDPAGLDSLRAAFEAAEGPALAGAALLLARFLVYAGGGREVVERVEPVLVEMDDDELRARLEAALITAARAERGLREVADAHLVRVRPLAAEDSPAGRVIAVQCAYAVSAAGDPATEAVALARTALGGGRLLDEEPLSPDIYLIPLSMLAICDELDEAAAGFEDALDRARRSGSPLSYAATAAISSWTAILRGRLDQGELLARDALRIAAEVPGLEALRGFAGVHLALATIERGDPAAALELLGPDIDAYTDSPHTWSREALFALGRARLALREPEAALPALLACGELSEAFGIDNPAFLPWRSAAALALRELGEAGEATERAEEEVALARRFGAARPLGIALRAAGLVRGGTEGVRLLEESAAVLADSPARLERAHTAVALGAALRRGGRRADSREPLAAGLELAEACGAAALAQAAREELGAGGARVRAGGRWDADALTASELRTCRMAAAGLSNPAIAQALFVTRATVESHLHAAYRKLGITSRAALPEALLAYD